MRGPGERSVLAGVARSLFFAKKYRVTYCARTSPLPLLPSGPGGVGGITSRRTRHLLILALDTNTASKPKPIQAESGWALAVALNGQTGEESHQNFFDLLFRNQGEIEAIEVHHLGPGLRKLLDEEFLRIAAGVDLSKSAELRI
jgi:hypothetical protein